MSKETTDQETSSKKPAFTRQLDLYHSASKKPPVQYEVVKLPLQDYVSTVRKAVCQGWTQVRGTVRSSVSTVRTKAYDQLRGVGIKDPTTVMQASAVGTAALVGLFMARKKSMFHRVLYPLVGGSITWGVIVFATPSKREHVLGTFKKEFSENFQKHFPAKELSEKLPKKHYKYLPKDWKEKIEQYEQTKPSKASPDTSENTSKTDTSSEKK